MWSCWSYSSSSFIIPSSSSEPSSFAPVFPLDFALPFPLDFGLETRFVSASDLLRGPPSISCLNRVQRIRAAAALLISMSVATRFQSTCEMALNQLGLKIRWLRALDDKRFSYQAAWVPCKETSAWFPLQFVCLPSCAEDLKGSDSGLEHVWSWWFDVRRLRWDCELPVWLGEEKKRGLTH